MEKHNVYKAVPWFSVLQTSGGCQTAVMSLRPGAWSGEKGNEHPDSEQILLVLEGEVTAEIGEKRTTLKKGDSVIVPRKAEHRFGNLSEEAALTFNVYTPPAY